MGAHAPPLPLGMSRNLDADVLRAEEARPAALSVAASAVLIPAALMVFIPYVILESGFGYRVPLEQVRVHVCVGCSLMSAHREEKKRRKETRNCVYDSLLFSSLLSPSLLSSLSVIAPYRVPYARWEYRQNRPGKKKCRGLNLWDPLSFSLSPSLRS
jgi:hypothetical protein